MQCEYGFKPHLLLKKVYKCHKLGGFGIGTRVKVADVLSERSAKQNFSEQIFPLKWHVRSVIDLYGGIF